MKNNIKNKKGFVALTIALSVSGLLLAIVAASSIESGIFFDQSMRKEYRTMNYYNAYSCLDKAILTLSHDYFFTVTKPIDYPEFYCQIMSVKRLEDYREIVAVGNYQNARMYRKAVVLFHDNSLEVISIE